MTGFNDLPNEFVLELWHHVLPPHDIASFALVSKRIFAFAAPFIREYHRMKSKYAVIHKNGGHNGSILAHLLKDVLLNPLVALYVQELHVYDWHTHWKNPSPAFPHRLDSDFDDPGNFLWHVPYPEQDMDLFRDCIRKANCVLPSEVDMWIQLLESGHEDPILALLLSLLPNLCKLSLEHHPEGTFLFATIRRIAETAPSTWLLNLRCIYLSEEAPGLDGGMSLVKPFLLLPSVEKISCYNLDSRENGHGIPDFRIAPRSSNVTELIIDSCGGIARCISVLLEGIKALKKITYVAGGPKVDAFWIQYALHHHCRHSLEYLLIKSGSTSQHSEYMGTIGSLRSFDNLKTLDIEHSLLVNPDVPGDLDIGDLLPASIEAIYMTISRSALFSLRESIRCLVTAKRTRLLKLKRLSYHLSDVFDVVEYKRVRLFDMYQLCEFSGISLNVH